MDSLKFDAASLEAEFKTLAAATNQKVGALIHPARLADLRPTRRDRASIICSRCWARRACSRGLNGRRSSSPRPPREPMAPVPTANVDLRPLTTGELIDRGFTLYRRNFAGLLLLALLSQGGPLLVQVLSNVMHLVPTREEMSTLSAGAIFLKLSLVFMLLIAAQVVEFCLSVVMTFYVADIYLGREPSVAASFRRFSGKLPCAVWTCLLIRVFYVLTLIFPFLAEIVLVLWFSFRPPESFGAYILFFGAAGLLAIASLVPVLIVAMRLMVTVPVLALEGNGGWRGCKRSSTLVRHDPGLGFFYWGETRLSLLLLPLFVIQIMTSSITSLPLIIAQADEFIRNGSATAVTSPSDVVLVGSQILTYLTSALVLPLYTIAVLLFYFDVRIRSEGFDLEYMAQKLETVA